MAQIWYAELIGKNLPHSLKSRRHFLPSLCDDHIESKEPVTWEYTYKWKGFLYTKKSIEGVRVFDSEDNWICDKAFLPIVLFPGDSLKLDIGINVESGKDTLISRRVAQFLCKSLLNRYHEF